MISIRHLHKLYQTAAGSTEAIRNVSFEVHDGEFLSVVGPSGAGKSTLLKTLIGLQPATSGSVSYQGQVIDGPHPDFALVFQDYARSLYPWLSLVRNITLPLENRIVDSAERERIAHAILERVGLPGVGNKKPSQLSGGQQQRVAIARALAYSPKVLIMDEPFASVDAQTRFDLEDLVLQLAREAGSTVILVTHDIDEAVYMSDRVVVLSRAPSIVVDEIAVPLDQPRDQIATRAQPAYADVRGRILGLIRDQRALAAA